MHELQEVAEVVTKAEALKRKWQRYAEERVGTYEFRASTRYRAVADKLLEMGLNSFHTLCDVGAGSRQFERYLREERGWRGVYVPIDAVIDGTDLEEWIPAAPYDFITCIETLEHLRQPWRLLKELCREARDGVVVTTPNPDVVDVIKCDPTHVSPIPGPFLAVFGFEVERRTWFGTRHDSLLAWRRVGK